MERSTAAMDRGPNCEFTSRMGWCGGGGHLESNGWCLELLRFPVHEALYLPTGGSTSQGIIVSHIKVSCPMRGQSRARPRTNARLSIPSPPRALSFAMSALFSRHAPCWRRSLARLRRRTRTNYLYGRILAKVVYVPSAHGALCKVWNLANSFTPLSHARDTRHTRAHKHTHSHTLKIPRSSAAQSFDIEFEAQGDDEGEGGGSSV